jgi:DNA-binding transcriptional regulator PaaX
MPNKTTNSKILLDILAKTSQTLIDFGTFFYDMKHWRSAYMRGGSAYVRELKKLKNEKGVRLAYESLRRSKYITARKIGKKLIISLTAKGVAKTLSEQLLSTKPNAQNFYTVVIFDIPETERLARRQFRLFLRQSGFKKLQQSVWVSNNDVLQSLAKFIKQIKLQCWVNVFYAKNFLYPPHS